MHVASKCIFQVQAHVKRQPPERFFYYRHLLSQKSHKQHRALWRDSLLARQRLLQLHPQRLGQAQQAVWWYWKPSESWHRTFLFFDFLRLIYLFSLKSRFKRYYSYFQPYYIVLHLRFPLQVCFSTSLTIVNTTIGFHHYFSKFLNQAVTQNNHEQSCYINTLKYLSGCCWQESRPCC